MRYPAAKPKVGQELALKGVNQARVEVDDAPRTWLADGVTLGSERLSKRDTGGTRQPILIGRIRSREIKRISLT